MCAVCFLSKQKPAAGVLSGLVGSERCKRDRPGGLRRRDRDPRPAARPQAVADEGRLTRQRAPVAREGCVQVGRTIGRGVVAAGQGLDGRHDRRGIEVPLTVAAEAGEARVRQPGGRDLEEWPGRLDPPELATGEVGEPDRAGPPRRGREAADDPGFVPRQLCLQAAELGETLLAADYRTADGQATVRKVTGMVALLEAVEKAKAITSRILR